MSESVKLKDAQTLLSIFDDFPDKINERLEKIFHKRQFSKGSHIFEQGDSPLAIYIIAKGRIKISRVNRDGFETILCVRGFGDIFCPVPILDQGKQLGSAIALTEGELWWADQNQFKDICQESPKLLAFVQGDCLFEVRRLLNRMEAFTFKSIRERLAFTILDEVNRQSKHGGVSNELRLKQHELAALVGASREGVSRALSKLEDQGVLTIYRGRLVIHDQEKLKLLAGVSA